MQVDLQWIPSSPGWLLQITFPESLDPPLSIFSEFLADFLRFLVDFWSQFWVPKKVPEMGLEIGLQ